MAQINFHDLSSVIHENKKRIIIYMAVIDNDYQTNLLFKRFTGVAATQLDSQFSNEPFRSIKNIFSRDVFIEDIPDQAPISIFTLDNSLNWLDSDPSNNPPPSRDGLGGPTFADLYPDSKLQFYKNVELTQVPGSQGRVWWAIDSSNNNILKDTINFKYDDVNSTYLMRVKYSNGTVYINTTINSYPLFWVLDNQSGFLQLYQDTGTLLSAANIPTKPPKISFFKYIGKKGITNLDVSGQQQVGDISGIDADLSGVHQNLDRINRMILPEGCVDVSGAPPIYDISSTSVVRSNYNYTYSNLFIGHSPVMDSSGCVDHSQDPSLNIIGASGTDLSGSITFQLEVSGNCYVSKNFIVGASGGIHLVSASGDSHAIGASEEGNMEMTTSNHFAVHTAQKRNALYVESSGNVGIGTTTPGAALHVTANSPALLVSGSSTMDGIVDLSCNNIVNVGNLSFCEGGLLDLSCNSIVDVSNISFCDHNASIGPSGTSFQIKSDSTIYIEGIGNNPVFVENVFLKSNTIQSIGYISFAGSSVTQPNVRWATSGPATGLYEPNETTVGITCSGEKIATFSWADNSGIAFFRDLSMNMRQINLIADATDPSGVPSWGQVQQAIGSGSNWILNGNNITNNNTGDVIINQNLFVANDICSNQVLTYTNDDLALQSYNRFNSLLGAPRPPLSPLDTRLVASERYDSSQYPSAADPLAKLGAGTTVLVPIAICPVSVQQYEEAVALGTQPNLGFNACAYFTIKLYDGTALNSRFVPGTPNLGRAAPLQQIYFMAGLINKDNSEGGGQIQYEKIPFIKVLSNINLGRGAVQGGPYSQYPYYIDGLELWEDKTDTFPSSGGVTPYLSGNGTTYLILRLSANLALQSDGIPTQSLFTDFNCYYDVRMYKDNTGLNDSISNNNPATPSVQPNDWNLLTAYQQLWLLGNPSCTTYPLEWEDALQNNGIPAPNNFPLTENTGALGPGQPDFGNWFGNLFSQYHGGVPQFNLNHLTSADVSLNMWLEEPYGITNTKEAFLDEVRCYSTVDICGNTRVQNISCNNIDVNNSIDVGANQELRITESNILSTTGSGGFNQGLHMEAHNFYYKINTPGIGSGFVIDLNHPPAHDDKCFRVLINGWGTSAFIVGGSGTTQTQRLIPILPDNYDFGTAGWRYRNLYIGNVDASGNVDIGGNLTVDGTTDLNGDADISGNVDIDGDVDISGHTRLTDVSATNIDITNNLNVDGLITGVAETTFVEYQKRTDMSPPHGDWFCIARTKDTDPTATLSSTDWARGLFILDDDTNGVKEQIIFYAGTSRSRGNYVNVLAHNWTGDTTPGPGGPFYKNIRIDISGNENAGANLYVYKFATGGGNVHIRLYQNGRPASDGGRWVLTDASHANLDTTAVNLDISYDPNGKRANSASSLDHYIQGDMAIIGDLSGTNIAAHTLTASSYINVGNPTVIDLSGSSGTMTGLHLKIEPSGSPGTIVRDLSTNSLPNVSNSSGTAMTQLVPSPWNDGWFGNSQRIIIRPQDWMAGGAPSSGGPFVDDRITWYEFGGNSKPTLYKTLMVPPTGVYGYPYWLATAIIPNGYRIKPDGTWRVNTVSDDRANFNGGVGYSQWHVEVSYVSTKTNQIDSSGCSEMVEIGGSTVSSTTDRDNYDNPFDTDILTDSTKRALIYGRGYSYVIIRSKLHIVLSNANEGIADGYIDIERY